MRKIVLCALIFSFSLITAAAADNKITGQNIPPDTIITLQRGACEKRCAVYKVVIFADGTLIYDGQYNVHKTGVVLSKIDLATLADLLNDFNSVDYTQSTPACDPEGPLALLSISSGGKSRNIVNRAGCSVASQLQEMEDKVDKAANTGRWIK